jgi:cytochrome c2
MRLLRFLTLLAVVWGGGHLAPASALAQGPDYGGLTPGPGREAVYFTCTACHSLQQFSQQRMSREEWDATLIRMVENNAMAEPEPWARTLMLAYLSTHFGVDEEDWQGLPAGQGREEVFYLCQACHSLRTVTQQKLTRDAWDETLVWMVEEQGMPEPEAEERGRILDYLGTHLSP